MGMSIMMDRERLSDHGTIPIFWWDSDRIIAGGQGVVNQNEYETLTDSD
jgi:hypothetical protein